MLSSDLQMLQFALEAKANNGMKTGPEETRAFADWIRGLAVRAARLEAELARLEVETTQGARPDRVAALRQLAIEAARGARGVRPS